MFDKSDHDLLITQYSKAIDQINESLGQNIILYTNDVLSKNPYAGGGFEALIGNKKNLKKISTLKRVLFISKYLIKSLGFIILWICKKLLFNRVSPHFDFEKYSNLHVIDIFILSKNTINANKFKDRYLSSLPRVLKNNNLNYAYLPCFYQDGYNPIAWLKLYNIIKNSKHHFITEFDLLTWRNVLNMVIFMVKYPFILLNLIKKYKINNEVDEAIVFSLENSLQDYTLVAYVRYLVGVNLANKLKKAKILSYCEYQVVDRTFYKGVKSANKKIKIYAYQQLRKYSFFMNMQVSEKERKLGTAPDKIIVNGSYYIPDKTRYDYMALSVRNNEIFNYQKKHPSKKCLVVLPYSYTESKNILNMVTDSKIPRNSLLIKPHPILSTEVCKKYWHGDVVNGDIYKYLENSRIIITSVSGMALEAVSVGISVILISSKDVFFINPLISLGKGVIWEIAYNSTDLISTYKKLIKNREKKKKEIARITKEYRLLFFTKPTENLILKSFDAL